MPSAIKHFFEFGPFRLDADMHRLMREGELVHLSPKAIDALLVLVQNPGKLLEREALMQAVWAESFVEDANLTVAISHLRKALGQNGETAEYIETVPRAGYRFVADVREVHEEPAPLIIEKRTLSRTVIEEEDIHPASATALAAVLPSAEKTSLTMRKLVSKKQLALAVAVIGLATVVGIALAVRVFREPGKPTGPAPVRSMAVLPFRVVGAKGDDAQQGMGLADILITRLSNLRDLKVRPTSAVLAFENREQDSISFGKKLGVDAVLEGTIYRTNDKVRVTARLLRVADGSAIWNGEFEKFLQDELRIQDEIALQVVDVLALNLSGIEKHALTKHYTEDSDAYQIYLKGRYEWNKRSWAGTIEAERLFRNAIEKDPNFALAYVGLADTMATSIERSEETFGVIQQALESDPNLAEAYATLGFLRMFHRWRWQEAESAFKKSIELHPGYAPAHHWYAELLTIQGRHEEAKSEMRRALEINPLSHNSLADLGQIYYFNREYKEAEEYCRKALEIYPDFEFAHNYLFFIYLKTGEHDKAVESKLAADRIHSTFEHQSSERERLIEAGLDENRKMYRKDGIKKFVEDRTQGIQDGTACSVYATYYAFLGEREKALACLEKAYEARSFLFAFVKADPMFDDLRTEPRYQAILKSMGLDKL